MQVAQKDAFSDFHSIHSRIYGRLLGRFGWSWLAQLPCITLHLGWIVSFCSMCPLILQQARLHCLTWQHFIPGRQKQGFSWEVAQCCCFISLAKASHRPAPTQLTLEQHSFNCTGLLIHRLLKINMQLVLCVCTFHCPMPLYIRDLSVLRFWYLLGVLEPVSCGYH